MIKLQFSNLKNLGVLNVLYFSSVRYSNPKLMHIGHQHMAQTFDPKQFKGLLELQTFHISPDKGLVFLLSIIKRTCKKPT